jgi:hypothetical protein
MDQSTKYTVQVKVYNVISDILRLGYLAHEAQVFVAGIWLTGNKLGYMKLAWHMKDLQEFSALKYSVSPTL